MGKGIVPNRPHLLVVPNSLVDQWTRELRIFFKKGTIEIYQVPGKEEDFEKFFIDPKMPWMLSKTPMVFRILLCTTSVCTPETTSSITDSNHIGVSSTD